MAPGESPRRKPRERTHHYGQKKSQAQSPRKARAHPPSSSSGSQALSADSLARLNLLNQHEAARAAKEVTPKKTRRKRHREVPDEKFVVEKRRQHKRKKRRVVSGAMLEEGDGPRLRGLRGGARYDEKGEYDSGKRKKRLCRFPLGSKLGTCPILTCCTRDLRWSFGSAFDYYNTRCDCS
jgi:glucan 1,3-beta-glucosidase